MPIDANTRGLSCLAGFGLLLTAIVLAYLNSTTTAFFWSTVYILGLITAALASAAKFSIALGVENKLAHLADAVASIVPWVAIWFDGIQSLHYAHDGIDGMMAGIAIIALVFVVAFGVADSLVAWFGTKYHGLAESTAEFQQRAHAVRDALTQRH